MQFISRGYRDLGFKTGLSIVRYCGPGISIAAGKPLGLRCNVDAHRFAPGTQQAAEYWPGLAVADRPAAKVLARWQEKCPARNSPTELLCTDCHGEHRLKFRSYWWDKKTREFVVPKEGEPRTKPAPDLTKKPS